MNGNAFLKQLLGRKPKRDITRGKIDDVRVQTTLVVEQPLRVQPWGKQPTQHLTDPVKDFYTGEMVERYSYRPDDRGPCAGCGKLASYFDHKFGWRVCISCDSDEVAADVSREANARGAY